MTRDESDSWIAASSLPRARWILIYPLLALLLYAPGGQSGYFADDFLFIQPVEATLTGAFLPASSESGWYRPIETVALTLIQRRVGLETWPIHALAAVSHGLICLCVAVALGWLGFPPWVCTAGACVMLLSQANAMAVLSNDTLSLVLGTLFGCLSLLALLAAIYRAAPAEPGSPTQSSLPPLGLSVVGFGLTLLCKEAGAGFLPVLLAVVALALRSGKRRAMWLVTAALYALVLLAYLGIRAHAGVTLPAAGVGRYGFEAGPNLLLNFGMLMGSGFLFGSSVWVFESFARGQLGTVAAIAFASLIWVIWLAAGLRREPRRHVAAACLVLGVLVLSPAFALRHVSELYAYSAMPFLSAMCGIAIGRQFETWARPTPRLVAFAALMVIWGTLQVGAVIQKGRLMTHNGERATHMIQEIEPYVASIPQGGELVLVQGADDRSRYSVFLMSGVDLLRFSERYLPRRFGRPDVRVRIAGSGAAPAPERPVGGVVTLRVGEHSIEPMLDRKPAR